MATLVQGSDEWLEKRKQYYVTASEVGTAIGVNIYESRYNLYLKKKHGKRDPVNDFKQQILNYGTSCEFVVDSILRHKKGYEYKKVGIYEYNKEIAGSPDGVLCRLGDNCVYNVEIKCPWKCIPYESLPILPPCHYVQMMTQMAATKIHNGLYVCWTPSEIVYVHVVFKEEHWMELLLLLEPFLNTMRNESMTIDVAKRKLRTYRKTMLIDHINRMQKDNKYFIF